MATRYADIADLAAYGLPTQALAVFTSPEQDAALDAASAVADGFLNTRFELPITAWGLDLRMNVAKLAAWGLMSRRGFKPGAQDADSIRAGYTDALAWLEQVANGTTRPTITDSSVDPVDSPHRVAYVVSSYSVEGTRSLYEEFFGHITPSGPYPTVGTPRLRGWR